LSLSCTSKQQRAALAALAALLAALAALLALGHCCLGSGKTENRKRSHLT